MVTLVPPAVEPEFGEMEETVGGRIISVPTLQKVEGELWLLYSVLIQSALLAIFEIRTSSIMPSKNQAGVLSLPMNRS